MAGQGTVMSSSRARRRRSATELIKARYVYLADFFDRWYEELPWRKRMPLGKRGEQIAARHLKRRGYIILARNYRAAGAEIDLIALEDSRLVFVEVKTRKGADFGIPQEAVDDHKQDQVRRAANAYAGWRGARGVATRFDVIAITGAGRDRKLELIKDAF
jgi:putative endonuclease